MKKLNKQALLWSLVVVLTAVTVSALISYVIWMCGIFDGWQILEIVILILLLTLYIALSRLTYTKVIKKFNNGEYDYVIKNRWKSFLYPSGLLLKSCYLYAVAMSCLELGEEDKFLGIIGKLKAKEEVRIKYYSLIVYHSYKGEYDKIPHLKEKYDSSMPIPQLAHFDEMLSIIEKCQKGAEYSESELETVKKVKSNVMKKILSLKN